MVQRLLMVNKLHVETKILEKFDRQYQISMCTIYKIKTPHVKKRHPNCELSKRGCYFYQFDFKKSGQRAKNEKKTTKPKVDKFEKYGPILRLKRIIKLSKTLWYRFQMVV